MILILFYFDFCSYLRYGDIVCKTWISKIFTFLLSIIGVTVFALPASIIGTSLSIKTQEDYRKSLKYRKAVRLIQSIWRCRISSFMEIKSSSDTSISSKMLRNSFSIPKFRYKRLMSELPQWTERDLICIGIIFNIKYKLARYRFKRQNMNLSSYSDVSQQYSELWQRIDYIESDLSSLSNEIYIMLNTKLDKLNQSITTFRFKITSRYNEINS